jgi:hypothetical protein
MNKKKNVTFAHLNIIFQNYIFLSKQYSTKILKDK